MKILLIHILLIFSAVYCFPQEGGGSLGWGPGEIYVGTRGLGESETVQYKMIFYGSFWGGGPLASTPFYLNSPIAYSDAIAHYFNDNEYIEDIPNTNFSGMQGEWPFFRLILTDGPGARSTFAYGVYKLYIEPYDAFFYIDYRIVMTPG